MAGKRLLNPIIKAFACTVGMIIMGLFTYPVLQSGNGLDFSFYIRLLVFFAFAYLLLQSLKQVLRQEQDRSSASSPYPTKEPGE